LSVLIEDNGGMTSASCRDVAPIAMAHFMLAAGSLAQCPPQRLDSPSDFRWAYGTALAANERHLLVGDWRDHTLCGDIFCANGYAWAYERDAEGQWVFSQRIEPADLGWSAGFGRAIALDGDRAIITRTLGVECGGVPYIFEFDGEQWVETGQLCPPPGRGGQGAVVALHQDMALVLGSDPNVLVYHETNGVWTLSEDLNNPSGTMETSGFGSSVALNDNWVVIGAYLESTTIQSGGAVYVYQRLPSGRLELAQTLVAPDELEQPRFGISVAIEDETLAVGGYLSDRSVEDECAIYLFGLVEGNWVLRHELTHDAREINDKLGWTVALDGDLLLSGAIGDRTPMGSGNRSRKFFQTDLRRITEIRFRSLPLPPS
jgi:hypothetical protein